MQRGEAVGSDLLFSRLINEHVRIDGAPLLGEGIADVGELAHCREPDGVGLSGALVELCGAPEPHEAVGRDQGDDQQQCCEQLATDGAVINYFHQLHVLSRFILDVPSWQ